MLILSNDRNPRDARKPGTHTVAPRPDCHDVATSRLLHSVSDVEKSSRTPRTGAAAEKNFGRKKPGSSRLGRQRVLSRRDRWWRRNANRLTPIIGRPLAHRIWTCAACRPSARLLQRFRLRFGRFRRGRSHISRRLRRLIFFGICFTLSSSYDAVLPIFMSHKSDFLRLAESRQ